MSDRKNGYTGGTIAVGPVAIQYGDENPSPLASADATDAISPPQNAGKPGDLTTSSISRNIHATKVMGRSPDIERDLWKELSIKLSLLPKCRSALGVDHAMRLILLSDLKVLIGDLDRRSPDFFVGMPRDRGFAAISWRDVRQALTPGQRQDREDRSEKTRGGRAA